MLKTLARHILTALAAAALLAAPSCNNNNTPKDDLPPQTLVFYFTGTQLSYYFYRNISAVKDAVRENTHGRSRVVCFFQNNSRTKADIIELVHVNGSCEEKILGSYDLPAMMDGDNLGYYFKEIIRLAPAQRYGLVMAGHALAWIPADASADAQAMRGVAASARRTTADDGDFWRKAPSEVVTRYFGEKYSDSQSNCFDIETLSEALASTGVKFEYILFDACFMANVEAAYDLRANTRYIIGAPCEIMGDGFPYQNTLPELLKEGGRAYDLPQACRTFYDRYSSKYGYSGSVALIDCSQLDALAATMKKINAVAGDDFDPARIQTFEGQTRHVFYDLGDYVDNICGNAALKAEFDAKMDKAVPCKYTLDSFWSNYGQKAGFYPITAFSGLSTSAPSSVYRDSYAETAWYKATH